MLNRLLALAKVLLLCGIVLSASAAELSPEAIRLERLRKALVADPENQEAQLAYLSAFPTTESTFRRLFFPDDFGELYDGHEQIFLLGPLSKRHPAAVGKILIAIAKEATWDVDAFNYLQWTLSDFVAEHPSLFVEMYKRLSSREQKNLLTFLADGIDGPSSRFETAVTALRKFGASTIATSLEKRLQELEDSGKFEH